LVFSALAIIGGNSGADLLPLPEGEYYAFPDEMIEGNSTPFALEEVNTYPGLLYGPTAWTNNTAPNVGEVELLHINDTDVTDSWVSWVNTSNEEGEFLNVYNNSVGEYAGGAWATYVNTPVDCEFKYSIVGLDNNTAFLYNETDLVAVYGSDTNDDYEVLGASGNYVDEDLIVVSLLTHELVGTTDYYNISIAVVNTLDETTEDIVPVRNFSFDSDMGSYFRASSWNFAYNTLFYQITTQEYYVVFTCDPSTLGSDPDTYGADYTELYNGTWVPYGEYNFIKPLSDSEYVAIIQTNENITMIVDDEPVEVELYNDFAGSYIERSRLIGADNNSLLISTQVSMMNVIVEYDWDLVNHTMFVYSLDGPPYENVGHTSTVLGDDLVINYRGKDNPPRVFPKTLLNDTIDIFDVFYYPETITLNYTNTSWVVDLIPMGESMNFQWPDVSGVYTVLAFGNGTNYMFFAVVNATSVDTNRVTAVTLVDQESLEGDISSVENVLGYSNSTVGELNGSLSYVTSSAIWNTTVMNLLHNVTVRSENGTPLTNITTMYTVYPKPIYVTYDNGSVYVMEVYNYKNVAPLWFNSSLVMHVWNGSSWVMNQTIFNESAHTSYEWRVVNVYAEDGIIYMVNQSRELPSHGWNVTLMAYNGTASYQLENYTLDIGYEIVSMRGNHTIVRLSESLGAGIIVDGTTIENGWFVTENIAGINDEGDYFLWYFVEEVNGTLNYKAGDYEIVTGLPSFREFENAPPEVLDENFVVGDSSMIGMAMLSAPSIMWLDEHPTTIPEMNGSKLGGVYVAGPNTIYVLTYDTRTSPAGSKGIVSYLYEVDLSELRAGQEHFIMNLEEGWNLVSVPMDGLTSEYFFEQGEGNVTAFAMRYSNGTYVMEIYDRTNRTVYNLSPDMGFYLFVDIDLSIEISDYVVTNVSYNLSSGWNLIGLPYGYEETVNDLVDDLNLTALDAVVARAETGEYVWFIDDFTRGTPYNIETGYGYFVYVSEDNVEFTLDTSL